MDLYIIKICIFKLAKDTRKKYLCFISAKIYHTIDDKKAIKSYIDFCL